MPNEIEHIQQANRNDAALKHLMTDVSLYSEWVTTVAFYKAVHVVEAMFYSQYGKNSHDHVSRLDTLINCNKKLYKLFRPLYSASMVARYLCNNGANKTTYSTFADYLSADDVVNEMIMKCLAPIEQIACNHLSKSARDQLAKTYVPPPTAPAGVSSLPGDAQAS
jgi:hypothetical protein